MSDVKEKLIELVSVNLEVDASKITDDASFINDLGADSLDTVELIMALEEEFKIEIEDSEAEGMKTFGDVHNYILKKIS